MLRTAAFMGLFAAGACAPAPPAAPNACQQARTYGAMFGTPDAKGPCWGRTISAHEGGGIGVYMFEMPLPGYAIGSATYQGRTLIQAGVTRG